jgi:GDP-4-dehydro-6-deoxy-D-mannose reductase
VAVSTVRALITGADGFIGTHLARHLATAGDEVVSVVGPRHIGDGQRSVDVRDADAIGTLIRDVRPDVIYHLAALVTPGHSMADAPADAIAITVAGTANVLAAARALPQPPIVHIPSSAAVYGTPVDGATLAEDDPLRPESIYGATKASQEMLGLAFQAGGDVPVVITRSFNHLGPGQRTSAALPSFASRLAEIALGRSEPTLAVGNLDVERDFSDVRDAVAAFRRLVVARADGPVNVCSGTGVSLRGLLDALVDLSGLEVAVVVDPSRVRSADPPRVVGDTRRLSALAGSVPPPPTSESLTEIWLDALDRARTTVHAESPAR